MTGVQTCALPISVIISASGEDLANMRDSIGGGFRFLSPMGPMGFAYGIKLDQATGEESGEFHFSAGNSF